MEKLISLCLFCTVYNYGLAQSTLGHAKSTTLDHITSASFDNYANNYNYTYWVESWKTNGVNRAFVNHTSKYALDIDFSNLTINSLLIDESPSSRSQGFSALHSTVVPHNYQGTIDYAILQNGAVLYAKSNSPTSTGNRDSQMAKYGVWQNTRFVSTNHTNSATVDPYFTGLEFSTWHDRLKLTYHVKPTSDILNGQLRLAIELPSIYTQYAASNNIHAFGLASDKGFAIKAGSTVDSIRVNGNQITIYSAQQDLQTNQSYEISLLFYAVTSDLTANYPTIFEQEGMVQVTAAQVAPYNATITDISYDQDQGTHFIKIPRINMGYANCNLVDGQQRINVVLRNTASADKKVRLCIWRQPHVNVTGFNSLICNANGDPSGLPLQISKNWHTGLAQLYSGSWIYEYTEIVLSAHTTLNFQYKSTGAKWGETYAASSHQLSVAGAGVPRGGWLEAALGTFGENITHSPDYQYGNTNGADLRPFLVTNQAYGGTSSPCFWTGNSGGYDMWVYQDASNVRRYQSQVKTDFKKYSPNLTETSISAVSADKKLKLDYTFYLNRSDDYTRVYYKMKIKALDNVSFNRFDIFQLGGDIYNIHTTQQVVYGNDTGKVAQFLPNNNGSNNYTTAIIPLEGTNPWLWAGDGLSYTGATSGIDIDVNNGIIIRSYQAVFNGIQNNTPYVRERSSSIGFSASHGTNPTSYCLVPPAGVSSFSTGDSIELLIEVVVLPKQAVDYYGPNANFADALNTYGNSYELLLREARQNKITASSPSHTINSQYPLTVETSNNTGLVDITGGVGYVPLVFSKLTHVDNPKLWVAEGSCWKLVDQSVHGKDFWQAEYNETTKLFDLVYNVNQDLPGDSIAHKRYYLGDTPPSPDLIRQSQVQGTAWTSARDIHVEIGTDSLRLAPQVDNFGTTSTANNNDWEWTGPNGFTHTGRVVDLHPVASSNIGLYTVSFTDSFGCTATNDFNVVSSFLSLESLSFEAELEGKNTAKLHWTTSTATESHGFEIQQLKPTRGERRFEKTAYVKGKATNSQTQYYELNLPNLERGTHYFRIKRIDDSGIPLYSETRALTVAENETMLTIYPNPTNNTVNIELAKLHDYVLIELYDGIGALILRKQITKQQLIRLHLAHLPSASYTLKVQIDQQYVVKPLTLTR